MSERGTTGDPVPEVQREGEGTLVTKAKCMACGLHFAAYSWAEDWQPRHCPECGNTSGFMVWQERTGEFIFNLVPGSTPMTGMSHHTPSYGHGANPN